MIGKYHGKTEISDNRRSGKFMLLVLCLFSVVLFCSCSILSKGDGSWIPSVPVMLEEADGVKIVSQNPVMIPLGSDAVFDIILEDAAVVDSVSNGAVIEDGKLTLKNVFYPVTIKLATHIRTLCEFSALTEENDMGSVVASHTNGTYWSETEVKLTATPKEGFVFSGFSIGEPVSRGGAVTSLDPSFTFILSQNVRIYANFEEEWVDPATLVDVPEDKWVLLYHSNGGVLSETGKEGIRTVYFSNTYYSCPNTIPDRDFFEREGYLLYGYNTCADGSGTYYGLGWNVVMPEIKAISLYCMWVKISDVSDFTYVDRGDGTVSITRYNGNDEFVVLPETINGKPVSRVGVRAFSDNTTMKKVMINKNIRSLSGLAFFRCSALEEMYFTDAVTQVGDQLLWDCPNFHRIYMLAYVSPFYRSARQGNYEIKYERLITADEPKLIVVSGSNSTFAIDSPYLEELLKKGGHEFNVVNYGTNAGSPMVFYLEVISKHINEGDVVVISPEINSYQLGSNKINTTLWQIFEGAYGAFSQVDIRNFTEFFSSFAAFNNTRHQTKYVPNAYELHASELVNYYGDYYIEKIGYSKSYANTVKDLMQKGGVGTYSYSSCVSYIKSYKDNLNRAFDMIKANGGTVLISFGTVNKICLKAESQIPGGEQQRAYEAAVDKYLNGTRISRVATSTLESELFYNSHFHVNTAGSKVRTEQLVADMLAYFADKE